MLFSQFYIVTDNIKVLGSRLHISVRGLMLTLL